MNFQEHLFVGVDTHKNNHSAAVINFFHQTLTNLSVPNNAACFADFIDQLEALGHNDETLVLKILKVSAVLWLNGWSIKVTPLKR